MSLSNLTSQVTYTGDGVTTVFPFSFNIPDSNSISVYIYDTVLLTSTLLVAGLYTVSGYGLDVGGTVTYTGSGVPLPSTKRIVIWRTPPYVQALNLNNQSSWLPVTMSTQLDKIVMQIQEVRDQVNLAVQVPIGSNISPSAFYANITSAATSAAAAAASAAAAAISAGLAGNYLFNSHALFGGI